MRTSVFLILLFIFACAKIENVPLPERTTPQNLPYVPALDDNPAEGPVLNQTEDEGEILALEDVDVSDVDEEIKKISLDEW